jgi:general secretion pathway protein D
VLQAGGGPYTLPIQISGATDVATVALTITFDPSVISAPTVTQGSFMMQGGIIATFVPSINAGGGRIDIALSRPTAKQGASGAGTLAAITFAAAHAGASDFAISGVATTQGGQSIPLQFAPTRVTVR